MLARDLWLAFMVIVLVGVALAGVSDFIERRSR